MISPYCAVGGNANTFQLPVRFGRISPISAVALTGTVPPGVSDIIDRWVATRRLYWFIFCGNERASTAERRCTDRRPSVVVVELC